MDEAKASSRPRGEVITFYSFKGGVGRSMALANIAALEAQRGKRVLTLDFDFEAPGLHRYFLKAGRYQPERPQSGMLNLFGSLRERLRSEFPAGRGLQDAAAPTRLRGLVRDEIDSGKYIYKVRLEDPNSRKPRTVEIDFIAAARFDGTYPDLVHSFDWQMFYDDYAELFPAMVEELGSRYDMILVDSRTGVTDIGSICTMALPDKLVLVFSPNEQSLVGALDAGWQAVHGRKETGAARPLGIFPLVSRVEEGEEEQKRQWIKRARESFEKLAGAAYGVTDCDLDAYFSAVRIPHRGYYSYGERIAVEEQPVRESGSLAQMYDRLADALRCAGVVEAQRELTPAEGAPGDAPEDVIIKLLEAGKLGERPSEAVRAYDELIPRLLALRDRLPPPVDPMLVEAMINRADALHALFRAEEAVAAYRSILDQFGSVTDPAVEHVLDRARFNLGSALKDLGRYEHALAQYEELIARFQGRMDAHAVRGLAQALFAKGANLRAQERDAEAIVVCDRLLTEFCDSSDPLVQAQIVKATANKAASLARLGNVEAAMTIREEIIGRHRQSKDASHREALAIAWMGKLAEIAARNDDAKVVAEGDEMLGEFLNAREPEIVKCVAHVMSLKSAALYSLGRRDDALLVLNTLMGRFGSVRTPMLTEPIALALSMKSVYLDEMGRNDEARTARADVVRRFREESDPVAQNAVADALVSELRDRETSARYADALLVVDEFLNWFPGSKHPRVRSNFYVLLVHKSLLLTRLLRCSEAVTSADQAYEHLSSAEDAAAQAQVPRALGMMGFTRLCLGKQLWQGGDEAKARATLEEATPKLQAALELAPSDPHLMGDAAYAAFLLGDLDRARALLTRSIALGGNTVRDAELKDSEICPLPQDDDFRALIRSIPDSPSG